MSQATEAEMRKAVEDFEIPAEQQNMVENCSESELYMFINGIGGMKWRANHDGYLTRTDEIAMQAQIENAARQAKRYTGEDTVDANGVVTAHYWAWFRWWNEYIEGLSYGEWNKLEKLIDDHRKKVDPDWKECFVEIEEWRPKGDWKDRLKDEIKEYKRKSIMAAKIQELKDADPNICHMDAVMKAMGIINQQEKEDGREAILKFLQGAAEGKEKRFKSEDVTVDGKTYKAMHEDKIIKKTGVADYNVYLWGKELIEEGKVSKSKKLYWINIDERGKATC